MNPRPFSHESGALTTELSPPQERETNRDRERETEKLGVFRSVNQYGYIRETDRQTDRQTETEFKTCLTIRLC